MRNAGLEEAQAGIKIAGRNINNLRYADDTTLMAESKEELKSLLIENERREWKAGLKLSIQKTKIVASSPMISWQIDVETVQTVTDFIFLGSKITADSDCSHEVKRCLLLVRKWKWKSLSHVWLFRTPMGYTVHGILQVRILEWVAFPFSRASSQPRDWTGLLHCRQILYQLSHQGNPRIPERVAHPFSRGSSQPRNRTQVFRIAAKFEFLDTPPIF